MKNTLITLAFIAIGITSLQAQTSNRYDWGIEGGPNLSTFRQLNSSSSDPSPIVYGSAGFIFQYNTKKILSFKTGFSFQRKGFQIKDLPFLSPDGNFVKNGKGVFSYDYITLPLLVKASFGKQVKFFVNAGPYAGVILTRTERAILDEKVVYKASGTSGLSNFDFGIAGGIGIAIPIKESWMVHAELRNYFGLYDIDIWEKNGQYTNTTDLRFGVVYRLGFRE